MTSKSTHKGKSPAPVAAKKVVRLLRKSSEEQKKSPQEVAGELAARMVSLGKDVKKKAHGARMVDYLAVQQVAIDAAAVAKTVPLWKAFIADKAWEGVDGGRPKVHHRHRAVHYAMRLHRGGDSKSASDRSLAVEFLLDHDIPHKELAAELKRRGGYRAVNKERSEAQAAKPLVGLDPLPEPTMKSKVRKAGHRDAKANLARPSSETAAHKAKAPAKPSATKVAAHAATSSVVEGDGDGPGFQVFAERWPYALRKARTGDVFVFRVECKTAGTEFIVTWVGQRDDSLSN